MDSEARSDSVLVRSRLPWIIAALALVVYLITLNHWVSLGSLQTVNLLTDPQAKAPPAMPLLYLVTLPILWLQGGSRILGLNALSAVFAALALAQLARSVALLPHNRTREERARKPGEHALLNLPTAWVPPLIAVLLCGFQLSFWEHATALTGDMLDLCLFAYVVRCLLEYRVDPRERWLTRMAFVYGLATTNNWAMIGYFPLALTAVIWLRGVSFFQVRFLLRMTLWGMAGLLLYLLLPLVAVFQNDGPVFWQTLRFALVMQKGTLLNMPRLILFLGGLTSLLPILLISFRWPSTFGDTSALGNLLVAYVFRLVYAVFLAFGLWMMLDAPFSPRAQILGMTENRIDLIALPGFLTLYYLAALAIGYFTGYFLLVLGRPEAGRHRRVSSSIQALNTALAGAVLLALAVVVGMQVVRNVPLVRADNGRTLKEFTTRLVDLLPSGRLLAFCDNAQILTLAQTLLDERQAPGERLLVNTRFLDYPSYQADLYRRGPTLWPDIFSGTNVPQGRIKQAFLMLEVGDIVAQVPSVYLHYSFGYFFEPLWLEPNALISRIHPYGTNEILQPSMTPELTQRNQAYWEELWPNIQPLAQTARRGSRDARMVTRWYSQAMNNWAVALQRSAPEELPAAATLFERALQLNPDNLSARINLAYNQSRQTGQPDGIDTSKSTESLFGAKYRSFTDVLRVNGPVDDPRFCFEVGDQFLRQSLHRQAAAQFTRAVTLDPNFQLARLYLAWTHSLVGLHQQVLDSARGIRDRLSSHPLPQPQLLQLICLESLALRGQGDMPQAESVLQTALNSYPGAASLTDALANLYLSTDQPEKALAAYDRELPRATPDAVVPLLLNKAVAAVQASNYTAAAQAFSQVLAREPDNLGALLNQSAFYIQTRSYTNAIPPLNRLLTLSPDHKGAILNRAIALLQSGDLDGAKTDYETLLRDQPALRVAHYGLGEIAYQRKNTAEAIEHYEAYLRTAPPDTEEARKIATRLESLKTGKL